MTEIKASTKKGQWIIDDLGRRGYSDIFDAYNRPSGHKVSAWRDIVDRAISTPGYNHDLHIVGASSSFFSTIYSYTDDAGKHVVKDTYADTYHVLIPAMTAVDGTKTEAVVNIA